MYEKRLSYQYVIVIALIIQFGNCWYLLIVQKLEKDKYQMISLICGIEKDEANEKHNKTETETQTQRTNGWLPEGRRVRGMREISEGH